MHYENHHFPEFLAGPPHPPTGPEVGPWYDRCAPGCDDQLAMFSRVGRGLKGDGFKVIINSDSDMETYLEGLSYDEASGTWASEWISENINGGRLDYQYNLRPYTIPQTFTITFRYRRPNRDPYQWTWTTPAIPYIWDADDDGFGDVDGIVGVGAATLFLKKTQDAWVTTNLPTSYTIAEALGRQEKLLYPEGWTRDQLNAPGVGDPYTINLTYGIGGDFDAPNIEDLSKVLGMTVAHIRYIIANNSLPTTDPFNNGENLRQYIDRRDAADFNHIHDDMGFGGGMTIDADGTITYITNNTQFADDGGAASGKWTHPIATSGTGSTGSTARTVKGYIDEGDKILRDRIKDLEDEYNTYVTQTNKYIANLYGLIKQLADHMPGVTMSNTAPGASRTPNENGVLTFPTGENIAVGNINLYSESNKSGYIKTHTGNPANKDLWAR